MGGTEEVKLVGDLWRNGNGCLERFGAGELLSRAPFEKLSDAAARRRDRAFRKISEL